MRHFRGRIVLLGAVLFILLVPGKGWSIAGQGVGVRVGYVFNYHDPSLRHAWGGTNLVPRNLSMVGGHIVIPAISKVSMEAAVEHVSRDYERKIILGDPGDPGALVWDVPFTVADDALYLTGRYKLIARKVGLHVGGGLNFQHYTYDAGIGPILMDYLMGRLKLPKDEWHSGFHILAGVSFGIPSVQFRFFNEVRFTNITMSGKASQQGTVLAGVTFGAF